MRGQFPPVVYVLPGKQNEVLLVDGVDLLGREMLADGAPVLVIDGAPRLVEHLPPPLPCHKPEIGVFQVEGRQDWVEAAEFQELPAVKGAGAAPPVEARVQVAHFFIDAVAEPQRAIAPPALGKAGFLAPAIRIAEEDLA